VEAAIKSLVTKEDIIDIKEDITDIKRIKEDFSELRLYIRKTNKDIIRWMFVFWLGQIAAMLTIVFLFLKK
jgi:hypothetical protein